MAGPANDSEAPSLDEDWHLEWRWGATHPWMRPKRADSFQSDFPGTSYPSPGPSLSSRGPRDCLSPCTVSAPSSSISSSSSCIPEKSASLRRSSADPAGPPYDFRRFPFSTSSPSLSSNASPDSLFLSGDRKKFPLGGAFATGKDNCPTPPDTSAACSTSVFFTHPWPVSFPFFSFYRRILSGDTHPASQPPSAPNDVSNPATTDLPVLAARLGGTTAPAAARKTPAMWPPMPASAVAPGVTETLRKDGVLTVLVNPVYATTWAAGADEWQKGVPRNELQSVRAPFASAAERLYSKRGPPLWDVASVVIDTSRRLLSAERATANPERKRHSDTLETGAQTAGEAVSTPKNVSHMSAPVAASATPATVTAKEHATRVPPSDFKEGTNISDRVQQSLLQFWGQTLHFLQKQQMAIWSVFALRDWRVKTLVHALSAMGEPVNLVVVDCTAPPHTGRSPSSDSYSSSSSVTASDNSVVSSRFSHPPSASSTPTFTLNGLLPTRTSFQGRKSQSPSPVASCSLSTEQPYVLRSNVSATAQQPPVASTLLTAPAASESIVSTAGDGARRPPGPNGTAIKTMTETQVPMAESVSAILASTHPFVDTDAVRGGYSPLYHTIWLCGNRLWSPFELRRVLLHELVHAFDFARANLSPNNCSHVACTEIRAYNLSGQCGWWRTRSYDSEQFNTMQPLLPREGSDVDALQHRQQPQRKNQAYDGGEWQQSKRNRCLTHGALNSLRQHRHCQAPGVAEASVRDVFTRCVRDTWPFLAPPERDSRWRPSRMWRPETAEFFKK